MSGTAPSHDIVNADSSNEDGYEDLLLELEEGARNDRPAEYKCSHSIRVGALCAVCGEDVGTNQSKNQIDSQVVKQVDEFVTKKDIKVQRSINLQLYNKNKLILILDLDQTVIHTTIMPSKCDFRLEITGSYFYVKVRPNLIEFLNCVSRMFEIHVYTMGTKEYAHAVCSNLDPNGVIFNKIISRDDSPSKLKKSIKRITKINRNVVILDDRADIWDYSSNLILVRPFWYYNRIDINDPANVLRILNARADVLGKDSADKQILEGEEEMVVLADGETRVPNVDESGEDNSAGECDSAGEGDALNVCDDDELLRIFLILKKIHKKVFKNTRKDKKGCKKWRNVLRIIRNKPLNGMIIAVNEIFKDMVIYLGGKIEGIPAVAVENAMAANYYKIKNIRAAWLYEMAYERKYICFDDYIKEDTIDCKDEINT